MKTEQVIDKLLEQDEPSPDQLDLGPTPAEKYADLIRHIEAVIEMLAGEEGGQAGRSKRMQVEVELDNLGLLHSEWGRKFYGADESIDRAVNVWYALLRVVKREAGTRVE